MFILFVTSCYSKVNFMMKRFLAALVLLAMVTVAKAQDAKPVWAVISVPQLKCWECKDRLEKYLEREKGGTNEGGITQYKINQAAGQIRIQYIPTRISLDYIRTAINNAGFDADTTKATPDAYKLLPPKCKRVEEGGGPKPGNPCKAGPMDRK